MAINKTYILLLLLLLCNICTAQFFKQPASSVEFSEAISKVVLDFRFNFQNIQGNRISEQGSTETYDCSVAIPGALETYIFQYNSRQDTTASIQCVMYRGDNEKEATRKYNEIYRMVKSTHIKWIDRTMISFKGDFEKPAQNVRFALSKLDLDLDDPRYKKFKAEVELVSTYTGWEVHLNLQTRKADDDKDSDYY